MERKAEARRQARATWTTKVFRPGEEELAADADAAFWDAIPIDERAGLVWELSQEAYSLLPETEHAQRGPARSVVRIVRR